MADLRRGAIAAFVSSLTALFTLPTVVAPTLLIAAPGCAGSDCEADVQTLPQCGGEIVAGTTNVWESNPVTGTYLDFHGERTWIFDPSGWMGAREPYDFEAQLAFQAQPTADGGPGFAPAAGNLSEFIVTKVGTGYRVSLLNDTCAQYYVRVVLTYPPANAGVATPACMTGTGASDAGR